MAKSHWNEISGYTWKQLITDEGRNTWYKLYHFVYTVTATGSAIFSSLSNLRKLVTFIVAPLSFAFSSSIIAKAIYALKASKGITIDFSAIVSRIFSLIANNNLFFSAWAKITLFGQKFIAWGDIITSYSAKITRDIYNPVTYSINTIFTSRLRNLYSFMAQGYIYINIENFFRSSIKLIADLSTSFSPFAIIRRIFSLHPNILAIETNFQAICHKLIKEISSFAIVIFSSAEIGKTLRKFMAQVQYNFNIVPVLRRLSRGLSASYLMNFSSSAILKGWLSVKKVISNWIDKDKPPSDWDNV